MLRCCFPQNLSDVLVLFWIMKYSFIITRTFGTSLHRFHTLCVERWFSIWIVLFSKSQSYLFSGKDSLDPDLDNDRTRNMKVARSLKSCLRRDDQGRLTSGLAGLPIANIFHTNVILQARPISFFSPTVFRHTTWPHILLWGGLRKLLWFVSQGLVGVRWVGAEKSTLLY